MAGLSPQKPPAHLFTELQIHLFVLTGAISPGLGAVHPITALQSLTHLSRKSQFLLLKGPSPPGCGLADLMSE